MNMVLHTEKSGTDQMFSMQLGSPKISTGNVAEGGTLC